MNKVTLRREAIGLCFFILFLSKTTHQYLNKPYFIIWNVGQGQWITALTPFHCHHFDWGGEKFPIQTFKTICNDKVNEFYFSHWDWDHIGGLRYLSQLNIKACLRVGPGGKSPSIRKSGLFLGIPICPLPEDTQIQLLPFPKNVLRANTSNEESHVFIFQNKFLIPGDSTQRAEKQWGQNSRLQKIQFLSLGHHGSRTSTSGYLLQHLPRLKLAVASARFRKYGHPHLEVLQKLKQKKIPVLSTEYWGSIWIEI